MKIDNWKTYWDVLLNYAIIVDHRGMAFNLNPQFVTILMSNIRQYDTFTAVKYTVKSYANEATIIEKSVICAFVLSTIIEADNAIRDGMMDKLSPEIKLKLSNQTGFKDFDDIMEYIEKEKSLR